MLNLRPPRLSARFALLALVALSALLSCPVAFAQTTVSNGSISGTVADATGAIVPNAKVTITALRGRRSTPPLATRERILPARCYSTTQPALGFPAGGLGPDNRLALYSLR